MSVIIGLSGARLSSGRIYYLLVCDMTYKMATLPKFDVIKAKF